MVLEKTMSGVLNEGERRESMTVVPLTIQQLVDLLSNGNNAGLVPSLLDPQTGEVTPLSEIPQEPR